MHLSKRDTNRIAALLSINNQLLEKVLIHMSKLDNAIAQLKSDVAALTAAEQAALALLNGINQRIADGIAAAQAAGASPAELQDLSDLSAALESETSSLAAAVAANTPAPAPAPAATDSATDTATDTATDSAGQPASS